MLGIRSWSNRRKAAVAATLAFLLWFPTGLSETSQPTVTGHSTFYNGQDFDHCLASIVGVMKTDVRWFNDMVLASRYGGKGNFIYITENGADDPTKHDLYTEGVTYDFVDPNGAAWHVDELFWGNIHGGADLGEPTKPKFDGDVGVNQRTYVWVVELSAQPIHDQFAGTTDPSDPNYHDVYNFVSIVDTCHMHRNADTNYYGTRTVDGTCPQNCEYDFNVTHNKTDYRPGDGHKATDGDHHHEVFLANIYVGTRPNILAMPNKDDPTSAPTSESSWAQSSGPTSAQNAQSSTQQKANEAADNPPTPPGGP